MLILILLHSLFFWYFLWLLRHFLFGFSLKKLNSPQIDLVYIIKLPLIFINVITLWQGFWIPYYSWFQPGIDWSKLRLYGAVGFGALWIRFTPVGIFIINVLLLLIFSVEQSILLNDVLQLCKQASALIMPFYAAQKVLVARNETMAFSMTVSSSSMIMMAFGSCLFQIVSDMLNINICQSWFVWKFTKIRFKDILFRSLGLSQQVCPLFLHRFLL